MLISPLALNMLIVAGFLYFSAQRILTESSFQLLAYLSSKQRELAKSGTMPTAVLAVAIDCEAGDLLDYFVPKKYHLIYVLGAAGQVLGIVSEEQVLAAIFEHGINVRLERLLE